MQAPTKVNFKIYRGSSFQETIMWESSVKGYATVSNISKAAPAVISAEGHGVPVGWRFKVSGVNGMKEINTDSYLIATSTTADTIIVNELNTAAYSVYTSGGVLEFNLPKPLAGKTARMQLREKIASVAFAVELTTENSGIVLSTVNNTIIINITPEQTLLLTAAVYVYDLDIIDDQGVTTILKGSITVEPDVTR